MDNAPRNVDTFLSTREGIFGAPKIAMEKNIRRALDHQRNYDTISNNIQATRFYSSRKKGEDCEKAYYDPDEYR